MEENLISVVYYKWQLGFDIFAVNAQDGREWLDFIFHFFDTEISFRKAFGTVFFLNEARQSNGFKIFHHSVHAVMDRYD